MKGKEREGRQQDEKMTGREDSGKGGGHGGKMTGKEDDDRKEG